MTVMEYSRLDSAEIQFLADAANGGSAMQWRLANASLSALIGFCSWNYPRPLYWQGPEAAWAAAEERMETLRRTPVYDRLAENVALAREIWREGQAHGHTDHLHEVADAFLNAMRDDEMYLEFYPDEPPRPQYGAR